jgi:site-specific DNA-cytosine methylase
MKTETIKKEVRHFHLFCGIGGGAKGFDKGHARVGNMEAVFRCIGGVDVDAVAIQDFNNLVNAKGTVLDMFSREQFIAFHGHEPPSHWKEATPSDIQRAASNEHPHIVFLSAPCKGFSGLLSETKSKSGKYQALNGLTLRGVWLMLEAFKDDPVELIVFENVPRIANRGRYLLDQIQGLLKAYGYAVAETTHDCGELGGLAQSRKRFLMVARHIEKVPPFLYEPSKKSLVSVGSLLSRMPMPSDPAGGAMHRLPSLQWKTWVRLAFVEAGSDWRSLNKLAVEDGKLRDYLLVPEFYHGYLGVNDWDKNMGAVAGRSNPGNGNFSVADPRYNGQEYAQYGVLDFGKSMGAVSGQSAPGGGTYSIADPRMPEKDNRQNGMFRVVPFDRQAGSITGASHVAGAAQSVADPRGGNDPSKLHGSYHTTAWDESSHAVIGGGKNGAYAVADPRSKTENFGKYGVTGFDDHACTIIARSDTGQGAFAVADPRSPIKSDGRGSNKYRVTGFNENTNAVVSGSTSGNGAFSVADPRPNMNREKGDNYLTGGHYGVVPFDTHTGAVSGSACLDNGNWSVADPRMPEPTEKLIAVIRSLDNTWHRPFTTLELAVIQSLIEPEEFLLLSGMSDQAWREHIGNMVPPDAAEAVAGSMGTTLLLAWSGETFMLSSQPIWVQPIAIAMSVSQGAIA